MHTFTIARGSESVARTAVFRLHWNGISRARRSGAERALRRERRLRRAYFAGHPLPATTLPRSKCCCRRHPARGALRARPGAARCDRQRSRPAALALLGLDPALTPVTSFTIGIDRSKRCSPRSTKSAIIRSSRSSSADARRPLAIEAIRARYRGTIRIDANEAWSPESRRRDLARARALRDRVLRAAHPGRFARAAALDSRARKRFRSSPMKTR